MLRQIAYCTTNDILMSTSKVDSPYSSHLGTETKCLENLDGLPPIPRKPFPF